MAAPIRAQVRLLATHTPGVWRGTWIGLASVVLGTAAVAAPLPWISVAGQHGGHRPGGSVAPDAPPLTGHCPSLEAMMTRPPLPPFTLETARQKVQGAEDAWNARDPERVAGGYSVGSVWRNRSEFVTGREQIVQFLTRKWERELDYALRKELWAFDDNHIAVRFQYESHDSTGQWWRSYGNELWEFDADGYLSRREASINDVAIDETERRIFGARSESEGIVGPPLQ